MFVTPAYAQSAGAAPDPLLQFLPIILMIAVFYMFVIRPQMRKAKEHQKMLSGVRRGDEIVTGGGIVGKVTKVGADGSDELEVQIADGVKVKILRSTVATVLNKLEPANDNR